MFTYEAQLHISYTGHSILHIKQLYLLHNYAYQLTSAYIRGKYSTYVHSVGSSVHQYKHSSL